MILRTATAAWLLSQSVTASAQTVTNVSTSDTFSTLSEALEKGSAGDKYEVDGDLVEPVTLEQDATIVGAASGASLAWDDDPVITLDKGVSLILIGVDLDATGKNWVLDAPGDNKVVVEDAEVDGAGSFVHPEGGMVHVVNPVSVVFDGVTFRGTGGVDLTSSGGAIWATVIGTTAALDLKNVAFVDVQATGHGGAVASYGLATTCEGCSFSHTEGGFGGAIYASGSLDVTQSVFCDTSGSLGGAIFASQDTNIVASAFVETEASGLGATLYVNGGDWLIRNNHFLGADAGPDGAAIFAARSGLSVEVRNSLFLDGTGAGLGLKSLDLTAWEAAYNWFAGNDSPADVTLDATNDVSNTAPLLVDWSADGICTNNVLWPVPFVSPLLDAGDPDLDDPDGTRSDIGAFGGPDADASLYGDADGDGLGFFWDCDDADPGVSSMTLVFPDCDGDGQGRPEPSQLECFAPDDPAPMCGGVGGWALERDLGELASADCDDLRDDRFVGAEETCEAVDRDCDGHPYDGAVDASSYYLDLDRDGFGDVPFEDCGRIVPGWSRRGGDCDDGDASVHPKAEDPCGDGVDQDCGGFDGVAEARWYVDADGDGFGAADSIAFDACFPASRPGFVRNALDCDDRDAGIRPSAIELCDGIDQDCDGSIDNPTAKGVWYLDGDGDGFGDPLEQIESGCAPDDTWVAVAGDCDDDDPTSIHSCPGCGCRSGGSGAGVSALILLALVGRRRGAA